jgi:hypothetical protein
MNDDKLHIFYVGYRLLFAQIKQKKASNVNFGLSETKVHYRSYS